MRTVSLLVPLIVTVLAAACTEEVDPGPPAEPSWAADRDLVAPALRLDVDPTSDRAQVRVVSVGAVELFGLSFHLRWDAGLVRADGLTSAVPIGSDDEAIFVTTVGDAEAAIGGSRRAPELGDVAIEDGTELASFTLLATATGSSRLSIERLVARQSDGGYLSVDGDAGTLTLTEVAR